MPLADRQREARIEEKGQPELSLEFDVFSDGSVSMWTHFDHNSNFEDAKKSLSVILEHLTEFMKDENMCPFRNA